MKKLILYLGIIALFFAGCGKDDSDKRSGNNDDNPGNQNNGGNPGGGGQGGDDVIGSPLVFLKAADLEPGSDLVKFDKYTVTYYMSDSDFYAHKPQDNQGGQGGNSGEGSELFSCFFEKYGSVKVHAAVDLFYINEEVDISECTDLFMTKLLQLFYGQKDLEIMDKNFSDKTRLLTMLRCQGGDFSKFDGKTIKEVSEITSNWDEASLETVCPKEGKRESLSNSLGTSSYKYTYSYVEDNKRITKTSEQEDKTTSAEMTIDGKSCLETIKDGLSLREDGCISVDKTLHIIDNEDGVADENMGKEEYEKIEYQKITSSLDPKAVWFSSGKINFKKGDWTGVVTYTAKDVPPTYKITNGSETATGQLGSVQRNLKDIKMVFDDQRMLLQQIIPGLF